MELPRLQYEVVLDLLFLAASQCRQAGPGARANLKVAVCVLLEEGLDVLQKALTSLLLFKPASACLEGDFQGPVAWGEARKPAKKSAAPGACYLPGLTISASLLSTSSLTVGSRRWRRVP